MEKSAALAFFVGAKNTDSFMKKGGMTYVQFSGTNFCIADSVGAAEAPDCKTERRGEKKQTKITYFKMRVDGNICSYFFHHADDRFNNYIFTKECFKMVYLVWALIALGIVVGIAFGVSLGVRMDLGKMSDGVIYVGRTSQEEDGANLFLNLEKEVSELHDKDYVVLQVKEVKARK